MKIETSVIIPCFNAELWIREAINSAITQGFDKAIEIIVVDDGSTDNSAKIVENEFPFVNLIKTENQGTSKARNLGTKVSKGEFIQYLDADDLLAPGKLKRQLELIKNSAADVVYGDWQKLIKAEDGKYTESEIVKRKLENPEIDLFTDFWCPPAVYLFRHSIIEKIGGWNEKLPVIQDARLALDCALHGANFLYCPGIMAYYRVHSASSLSSRNSMAFNRDILNNAVGIEDWWINHGGINEERKKSLLKVYGYAARVSFETDKVTFERAFQALKRFDRRYIPERPRYLKFVALVFGYRNAETIALWYRRLKSFVGNLIGINKR